MLTRCMGRSEHGERWYDKKLRACPECGCPTGALNPHLYTAKLNSHLYVQAESAEKEKKLDRAMRSGYEPDPPKWARQRAREIVRDL